ncbi:MAG: phage tail protein [Blastocatellia bacterium]
MAEQFMAEIRICSFNFPPRGWAACDGQLLPINQFQAIYSLLGTMYGGNGTTNFALPDLRGRAPIHIGNGLTDGNRGGEEAHTLIQAETPSHSHKVTGTTNGPDQASPAGNYWAAVTESIYSSAPPDAGMNGAAVGTAGGSQPHENMPPFLVLNYVIALTGIYPPKTKKENTMADQFLAEIRIFAGKFAPYGWAMCDGQTLDIRQNTALFSLLGPTYGGDGKDNFALPDLRGCAPIMFGQGPGLSDYSEGEPGGVESVTLLETEMPAHNHAAMGNPNSGTVKNPEGAVWAASGGRGRPSTYVANPGSPPVSQPMSPLTLGNSGGDAPHNNMPPYLALTFIIALQGIFPSRS